MTTTTQSLTMRRDQTVRSVTRRTQVGALRRLLDAHPAWRVVELQAEAPIGGPPISPRDLGLVRPSRAVAQGTLLITSFATHEFDFVIASGVLECAADPIAACRELMRIARRGYVEATAPLFHNLVEGHRGAQQHWVTFDDESQELVFRRPRDVFPGIVSARHYEALRGAFPESCTSRVYWETELRARFDLTDFNDATAA